MFYYFSCGTSIMGVECQYDAMLSNICVTLLYLADQSVLYCNGPKVGTYMIYLLEVVKPTLLPYVEK